MREYNIFFLGDEDSGKSSIFNSYSDDKTNYDNLIGIRKVSTKKKIGNYSETEFNFYDISPQECNKKIVKDLYQDVDVFVIFFNSEKTFESIDYYLDIILKYNKKGKIIIVKVINNENNNNEIDYEKKIKEKYHFGYYNECVTQNFDKIFERRAKDLMSARNGSFSLSQKPKNSKISCCWFLFLFY